MWSWQSVLMLLALAWLLQCAGTIYQVQRYRAAFRELSSGWSDGWMGVGKAGGFLRSGVIAMVVVAPDETLRRVVTIRGRTIFAKAQRLEALEGRSLAAVRGDATAASRRDPFSAALLKAFQQVDIVRAARPAAVAHRELAAGSSA